MCASQRALADVRYMAIAFKVGTWDYMWSINQMTDATLSLGSTPTTLTSASGATIAEIDGSKTATLSATNALFDLNLFASILGTEAQYGSATNKIVVPQFEEITVDDPATPISLTHLPVEAPESIYSLNGDETIGVTYTSGTAASDTEFAYADGKITVPTGAAKGDVFLVVYEYESTEAVLVVDEEDKFPVASKLIVEILGADVCSPSDLIYAYLVFPNAKLSSTVDITLATDGGIPFEITMMPGFCEKGKRLFYLVVPNPEADLLEDTSSGGGSGTP